MFSILCMFAVWWNDSLCMFVCGIVIWKCALCHVFHGHHHGWEFVWWYFFFSCAIRIWIVSTLSEFKQKIITLLKLLMSRIRILLKSRRCSGIQCVLDRSKMQQCFWNINNGCLNNIETCPTTHKPNYHQHAVVRLYFMSTQRWIYSCKSRLSKSIIIQFCRSMKTVFTRYSYSLTSFFGLSVSFASLLLLHAHTKQFPVMHSTKSFSKYPIIIDIDKKQ